MEIALIMYEDTLNDFTLGLILEVDRVILGNLLKNFKIQVVFRCGSGKMTVPCPILIRKKDNKLKVVTSRAIR